MALLNPRALMAYDAAPTRATCRLGARRRASGRVRAPERRRSPLVITKIDAAAPETGSGRRDTEVTSMLASSSRDRSARSEARTSSPRAGTAARSAAARSAAAERA